MTVYTLVELDTDLDTHQHTIHVLNFKDQAQAQRALHHNYEDTYHGLSNSSSIIQIADQGFHGEHLASATLVTENNAYYWYIKESRLQ